MQVIRNGAIYLGSSMINKAVPFLLLPLLTSYLSPAEFGAMAVFVVINGLVGAFVGMAMHTNIATNFYAESRTEMAAIIGNIVLLLSVTGSVAMLALAALCLVLESVFSISTLYLLLMPPLAVMTMIGSLNTTVLRNQGRAYAYASFEIGQMLIHVGVTVVLLVWAGLGWRSQVAGLLAANAVFFLIAVRYLHHQGYLSLKFDRERTRAILGLSLPLVPHVLGGVLIGVSDRLFIEKMVGLEAVGLYSIGYSFGMVMSLVTDACVKAWTPWVYRTLAAPSADGNWQIVKSCYALIAGFLVMAIVVAVVAKFLLPFMVTAAFRGAGEYIAWITLGYAVRGVYQVFFPFLVHLRRTHFLAISTVAAAMLNLALNYFLIREFGAIGGAYATVAAFALSAVMVFRYQSRHLAMPWKGVAA